MKLLQDNEYFSIKTRSGLRVNFRNVLFFFTIIFSTQITWSAVTNLNARFYKGKTYVTFTEEQGAGITYKIYRSTNALSSVAGMQAVATIPQGSGYDARYSWNHVISNLGSPLVTGTGLFVFTPHDTTNVYYAVTTISGGTENTTVISGSNVLASPVSEQYWQWPGAILRLINGTDYVYCYWMDYADWCHKMDYYGDLFAVADGGSFRNSNGAPLTVNLHGVANDQRHTIPNPSAESTELKLVLYDFALRSSRPANNWWFGVSKGYLDDGRQVHSGDTIVNYTQMRVVAYVNAMRSDSLFKIDTNRLYISGGSMGGTGAIHGALHFPTMWAACRSMVPVVNIDFYFGFNYRYPDAFFDEIYGKKDLGCRVRNGATIYQWSNPNWICQNTISTDYSPVILTHTSDDGPRSMRMYRAFYNTCNASRHALFGNWRTGGHVEVETVLPGGYLRFKKNELYPAFTNCSTVDDYGQESSDTSNAPVDPALETLTFAAAGQYATFIDWSSSLHDLGLPNDNLADSQDSISITLRSARASTRSDVTLRRIQTFSVIKNQSYSWSSFSVSNGAAIGNGKIVVDNSGLLTIPQLSILETGTRLVVKPDTPVAAVNRRNTKGSGVMSTIQVTVLDRSGLLELSLSQSTDVKIVVFDVHGKIVSAITLHSLMQGKHTVALNRLDCGVYVCKISTKNSMFSKRITIVQ
jgi:hypothetical protein